MQKRKKRIVILGMAFFIFAVFFLLLKLNIFTIKFLSYQPPSLSCADSEKIKNSTKLIGQNIFLVNLKKEESNLESNFFCIKSISFSRNFPDRIKITFQERKPVANLVEGISATGSAVLKEFIEASSSAKFNFQSSEGKNFLIDSDGVIYLQSSVNPEAPLLFVSDLNLSLGQKVDQHLMNSLIILEKIKTFGLNITETGIFEKAFMINTTPKIIFALGNDISEQIASLQLILEKAKINLSQLEFIDLRFDKPIVKIAPKK